MHFEFPWYVIVGFGFFIGSLVISSKFRNEFDAFLAHLLGLQERKRKRRRR